MTAEKQTTSAHANPHTRMHTLVLLRSWVARDFRIRTSQTALGSMWSLVNPIFATAGFVFAFHNVAALDAGVPYATYVFPGMLLWNLFAGGFSRAMESTAGSMHIASKANFPRFVPPVSAILLASIDLASGLVLLPIFMLAQGAKVHFAPLPILGALVGTLALTIGVGLVAAAVSIFIRDLKNLLPLIVQVAFFLTPVAYPPGAGGGHLSAVFRWNPMATFVTGFRAGFLDVGNPSGANWARAIATAFVAFGFGLWYFSRVQSRFPDVV